MKNKINYILGLVLLIALISPFLTYAISLSDYRNQNVSIVIGSENDREAAELVRNALQGNTIGNNTNNSNFLKIERSTNRLNLGESFRDIISRRLTNEDLPNILSDETFRSGNEDSDYEQFIEFGDNLILQYFRDTDLSETPQIGVRIPRNTQILTYTLDFIDNPESDVSDNRLTDFENTEIMILGRNYTIVNAFNSSNRLELLGGAVNEIIGLNESRTFTVNSTSYTVRLIFVDSDMARFTINGETTDTLEVGETFRLRDGSQIGVTDINYQDFAGGVQQVEFTLGANRIILENNRDIRVDEEDITNMRSFITRTAVNGRQEINTIVINWTADDDLFITPETSITMPALGSLGFAMSDFFTPTEEDLTIDSNDDTITLDVNLRDGRYSNLPILTGNGSTFSIIGEDDERRLVTSATNSITFNTSRDEIFLASWSDGRDAESYLFDITNIREESGRPRITIRNLITNVDRDVGIDDTFEFGRVTLTLNAANRTTNIVNLSIGSNGNFHILYTAEGLSVHLPVITSQSIPGAFTNSSTFSLLFSEEDEDENIGRGTNFTLGLSWSGDEPGLSGTSSANGTFSGGFLRNGTSDLYTAYVNSSLATRIEIDTGADPDTARITYHGSESYGNIYLTSGNASFQNIGNVNIVNDLQNSSYTNRTIIVIGGTCVNRIAAMLWNTNFPTCGSSFTNLTGAGSNQYVLDDISSPFGNNRRAIIIAGYERNDTLRGARAFAEGSSFSTRTVR